MLLYPSMALRTCVNRIRKLAGAEPLADEVSLGGGLKQAGQIVVVFVLMLTVLIGLMGIAIDATYAWKEALRVQRASDAASLAGVVYMPGSDGGALARDTATKEANKNGLTIADPTTISFPKADNPRELDVIISTPVPTFFSRIFGINSFTVSRSSKAIYVTPVPMGSPYAYYGIYQMCTVTSDCTTPEPTKTETGSPPNIGVALTPQGFFGAVLGQGSNKGNGDAFNPYYDNNPGRNLEYSSDGIRYEIQAVSSGSVYVFDPVFCATATKTGGSGGSGGHAGAGDHWMSSVGANNTPNGENTYFTLFDTHNLPLAPVKSYTEVGRDWEINPVQVDKNNATYGNTGNYGSYSDGAAPPNTSTDCQNNPHHNKWVLLGSVVAGNTYSLQVTTTDPTNPGGNLTQAFENMFSLAVSGAGNTIHGTGSMVTYANIDTGAQQFNLAQIDRTAGAGKTVQIELFDPGDTTNASWMQVLVDSSSGWKYATFNYTSTNGHTGTNVNCIQTKGGSGAVPAGCTDTIGPSYNDQWVSIMVTVDPTYGLPVVGGVDSLVNKGWWQIKYTVNGGNDTTTWRVSIRGNPVHLI